MAELGLVLADLTAEGDEVDRMVATLDESQWRSATPAAGWTVAHQIAHLHWTDRVAALTSAGAAGDSDAEQEFDRHIEMALADPAAFVDRGAEELSELAPADLLARWRRGRADLADVLSRVPSGTRIRWFGPPMSAISMATARLMETWAHGQDVADALGLTREPTARLRNIAHLGVRTRDFAFLTRGLAAPDEPVRVQLLAPDGDRWTWGPDDAAESVRGTALDFCLLVTQRVHRDDTDMIADGADADRWLSLAQAFAGEPGAGRPRRVRP